MGVQQQDGTDRKRMQTFHADELHHSDRLPHIAHDVDDIAGIVLDKLLQKILRDPHEQDIVVGDHRVD